jgi:hypothetical protein
MQPNLGRLKGETDETGVAQVGPAVRKQVFQLEHLASRSSLGLDRAVWFAHAIQVVQMHHVSRPEAATARSTRLGESPPRSPPSLERREPVAAIIGKPPLPSRSRTLHTQRSLRRSAIEDELDLRAVPTRATPRDSSNRPRQATIAVLRRLSFRNAVPVKLPAPRLAIVLHVHGTCRSATRSSLARSAHITAIRAAVAAVPPQSAVAAISACRSARRRRAATAPARMSASRGSIIAKPPYNSRPCSCAHSDGSFTPLLRLHGAQSH